LIEFARGGSRRRDRDEGYRSSGGFTDDIDPALGLLDPNEQKTDWWWKIWLQKLAGRYEPLFRSLKETSSRIYPLKTPFEAWTLAVTFYTFLFYIFWVYISLSFGRPFSSTIWILVFFWN
jgi:hypothetical protein